MTDATPDEKRAEAARVLAESFRAALAGDFEAIGFLEDAEEAAELFAILGVDRDEVLAHLTHRLTA